MQGEKSVTTVKIRQTHSFMEFIFNKD